MQNLHNLRVSVIVPCYNAQKYIKKCLDSLERQTYQNFEVIIVDDCSTDETVKFIENYKAISRLSISILQSSVNSGPALARERGIAYSTSDVIAFCDSDDWYDDKYIEFMINKMCTQNADVVFCGFRSVMISKRSIKYVDHNITVNYKNMNTKNMLTINVDSLCVLMVKRSIMKEIQSPNLRNGQDMAIVPIIISKAKKYGIVKECLYNYQMRCGSASLKANEKVVNSLIQSFKYIEDNLPNGFEKECEYIGIRNLLYGSLLNLFKYSNDYEKASKIVEDFEKKYKDWSKNQYIKNLPIYKIIFLKMIKFRNYKFAKLLSMIHLRLTRGQ